MLIEVACGFWSAASSGLLFVGIWKFTIASPVKTSHYLCSWLLCIQAAYFQFQVIGFLWSQSAYVTKWSRVYILPICNSFSWVVTILTVSSREGLNEIFDPRNCLLHIGPTMINLVHFVLICFSENNVGKQNTVLEIIWILFGPALFLLLYISIYDVRNVYPSSMTINYSLAFIASVVPNFVLCTLKLF